MQKIISILLIASFIILGVSYGCFADDAEDLYNKGIVYYKQGDFTNAMECFKESIMEKPNYGVAHYGIGLVYSQGGDYAAAVRHYTHALKNKPVGPESGYTVAVLWERAKAFDSIMGKELEAADDYREACYTYNHGNSCKVLRQKSEEWEKQGLSYLDKKGTKNHTQAKACFSTAIKIDPQYADPYFNRGRANAKLNHDDEAIEDYNKHIELAFESGGQDAPVYDAYFSIGLIVCKKAKATGNKQYWVSAEKVFGLAINNLVRRHESDWPKKTPVYFFRAAEAIYKQGGNKNLRRALRYLHDGCIWEKKYARGGDMICCRNENNLRIKLGLEPKIDWD